MARKPLKKNSESQNAPDYSGVVHSWGHRRLVVSPTGRRYLIQEYVPGTHSFRNVHWARTGSRLAQRLPELADLVPRWPLPENPAEAAPATVAKRAAEDGRAKFYPEFRCDYPVVVAKDGWIRIVVSPDASSYLWQVASTYKGSYKVRPNTWQNVYNACTASELKRHLAEAQIIWPDHLGPRAEVPELRTSIEKLPEQPWDGPWKDLLEKPAG